MSSPSLQPCSSCGGRILKGDVFCAACGAPTNNCTSCGASLAADDVFCAECGARREKAQFTTRDSVLERLRSALIGEFEVTRLLGRGGMGAVYLARDVQLDRMVAIKVLAQQTFGVPDAAARFRHEATTVAGLHHPNIVSIFAIREIDEMSFFFMQYVPGPSLAQTIAANGRLSLDAVRAIAHQVGAALEYAHRREVIHRDVKPANVLFDDDANALVTDFGIAKAASNPVQTQTGALVGTPAYMSPEQCYGRPVTPASDQYSLGVVLYEALAGRPPFAGNSFEVMQAHVGQDAPDLRKLRPDCPSKVADAVMRMLAKKPEDRWPSVDAAVAAFGPAPDSTARPSIVKELIGHTREKATPPLPARRAPIPELEIPAPPSTPSFTRPAPSPDPSPPGSTIIRTPPSERPAGDERASLSDYFDENPPAPSTGLFIAGHSLSGRLPFPVALVTKAAPDPGELGRKVPCRRLPFTIGRAESADLCVQGDRTLSREHAQIDLTEDGFVVRDLSTNGLYINGRHLKAAAEPLPIGATIALSVSTSFTFVADVETLPDLTGQLVDNRYKLGRLLHHSMNSATYLSTDTRIARSLALKVFSPSLMNLALYRTQFTQQADLAAKLQHPHICKIIDVGETGLKLRSRTERVRFLCTEFMEGGNLTERLEISPPSPSVIATWLQLLVDALDHAHRHGIVHGDLKPGCILFDREGTPYVTDFALAIAGESKSRSVVGSPDFLAPEQWEGEPPTAATDQYSLGVLGYVMFSGARPHEGQADPVVRARNFRRGAPPAHEEAKLRGRTEFSAQVSTVLAKAMSLKPTDRFTTILEFGNAVARAVRRPAGGSASRRVFLSYQRQSSAGWANLIAGELQRLHRCAVFIDVNATDGAPQIPDRLRDAILNSDVFVCLLAPGTLESNWVRQEIGLAFDSRIPMVPIFHEEFKPADVTRTEPSIVSLLNTDAVQLLDRRNIMVQHTITELGQRIEAIWQGAD